MKLNPRLIGVLLVVTAIALCYSFWKNQFGKDPIARELRIYREVRETIGQNYVIPVEGDVLLHQALKGMARSLDRYSLYYDPQETQDLLQETSGKFVGLGVVIESGAPPITILFPQEGGPGDKAGLRVGDRIIAVNDEPILQLPVEDAREKLRGFEGEELHLRVIGNGETAEREIRVALEALSDPTISKVHLLDPNLGIGYVRLNSFSHESTHEFDAAMKKLQEQGMKSLVLDLRFNLGGTLDSTVEIANRFIREGVIVSTRGRNENNTQIHRADPAECFYEGTPLIVLVNGQSASASEVLAGAIQDTRTGVLLGTTTYGKGVVQTLQPIGEDLGMLRITTSYYYTPANRNFEKRLSSGGTGGIEPDVVVHVDEAVEKDLQFALAQYDVPPKYRDAVEKRLKEKGRSLQADKDPQLDAALALLRDESPKPKLR